MHAALLEAHQASVTAYLGCTELFPAKDVLGPVCLQLLDAESDVAGKNQQDVTLQCDSGDLP